MPNAQGFDYYFGSLGGNDNGRVAWHENNQPAGETDDMGSLTRIYTEKAIAYLRNQKGNPFFLYLAHKTRAPAHPAVILATAQAAAAKSAAASQPLHCQNEVYITLGNTNYANPGDGLLACLRRFCG
jgi:hypothetical protein